MNAFVLSFLVLVILFLSRVETPVAEQTAVGNEVTIHCRDCSREYIITDTGERPLLHACPHCGYTDQYPPSTEPVVDATPEEVPFTQPTTLAGMSGPDALVLHCTSCGTNFETAFTEERPLVLNCANCGKRGILRPNSPSPPAEPSATPA
jgi:DNA-directed RNA polymerase subunit RPC12/RpoP